MPDVELQAPEIDDVDERATPFKRMIALLVVTITLFGSVVAYLQTVDSNKEDRAAREAQRFSVTGLGAQVDASAAFQRAYSVYTQAELLDRQRVIAAGRQRQSGGSERSELYALDAQRAAAVKAALEATSPLVGDSEFSDENDPAFPNRFTAEVNVGPDEAGLRQQAQAELANDHGSKADTFVAILTTLAVALFLLGLSLTVEGRSRRLLVIPGVGIAIVCVLWTIVTVARDVPRTPERAIRAVAEGNKLVAQGDPEGAIEAFTRAIEERGDYAVAFGLRAEAEFLAGSAQTATDRFVSITDPENLARAIDDSEKAIELGAGDDVQTVGGLGFYHFLAGDFAAAARLTDDALDLNERLPVLWFNAGVIEVARGDEDTAEEYYDVGLELLADEPDQFVRAGVLSGARVDLGIAREVADDVDDLAAAMEAKLVAAEVEQRLPDAGPPATGASMEDAVIEQNGIFLNFSATAEGLEEGDPVAAIWYFRQNDDQPFNQPANMNQFLAFSDDGTGLLGFTSTNGLCIVPGEYRVEVFSGEELLATATTEVAPGTLGEQVDDRSEVLSVELCRPSDWTAQEDLDAGTFSMGNPDGDIAVSVGVFSVGAEILASGGADELLRTTIAGAAGSFGTVDGPPEDDQVGNLFEAITVFATADDGASTSVSGEVGDDGVVRVVIASAPDFETLTAVHDELFTGIFFTDLA